jgi:hypothetical protein
MSALPTFKRPYCRYDGIVMTALDLPKEVKRWTFNTKAMFLNALEAGAITADDMHERYNVSHEELLDWRARYRADEPRALCENQRKARR